MFFDNRPGKLRMVLNQGKEVILNIKTPGKPCKSVL